MNRLLQPVLIVSLAVLIVQTIEAASRPYSGSDPGNDIIDHRSANSKSNWQPNYLRILKQEPAPPNNARSPLSKGVKKSNRVRKNSPPNKHVLAKLGVKKVNRPGADYYNDNSESNVVVVKLPPNPNYYINLQPCDENSKLCPVNKGAKNLPFNFAINGKPSKIYHYNLPMLDKAQRVRSSSKVLSHKRQTKNNVSVYQPALPNAISVNSYFKGNGKFQSMYVMSKKKKRKLQS
ncbi:uncharacterized protein LOC135840220 [Planococcus citri]|uniref:uncharacterized protein LOC135840220 n=1 Tax=Planococcus citri TaxID=170843 RepID=UPI0031F8C23A